MIESRFIYGLMLQPAARSLNAFAGIDSKDVIGSESQSPRLRES